MASLIKLVEEIKACTLCAEHLPLGPRPVLQVHAQAKILIVGQAPGTAVHASGIPFDDPSGNRLRDWLGVDRTTFYDSQKIALVPMGFCYPGRGKSGDLPPRPECAATWRERVLAHLQAVELTVVIGRYAIDWHLKPQRSTTLAEVVRDWQAHLPEVVPLPHPSPRNSQWLKKHPWVEADLIPHLRARVSELLS